MYSYERQINILFTCHCVHNHIHRYMPNDYLLEDVDQDLSTMTTYQNDHVDSSFNRVEELRVGSHIRIEITKQMWSDYRRMGKF